ncbi:MAG: type II toxin-antitoxin system RelE/ParE family toxin [Proteobacteria bacterium]|nr:type II toxin-antitoxin system RelE/ParE family toxin [Pseudomonadota bacterium]
MRVFKTKAFDRWATDEGLIDQVLWSAVDEMKSGLLGDSLGGNVYKKRMRFFGRGKRGSARILIAFRSRESAFFIFGFAKNERANINSKELKALKLLAKEMLGLANRALKKAIAAGELIEVSEND